MAKPTEDTTWATDASTTTEPTAGKKAAGWVLSEKPPAKWLNWWKNAVYKWITHFDSVLGTDDAETVALTPTNAATRVALTVTSVASNYGAVTGTGSGSGIGITGTGGGTSGTGVNGQGGASNGTGVSGTGDGTGLGLDGQGGDASGMGASGTGGAPNGIGVSGTGDGSGIGVFGQGGDASGVGVRGAGGATNGVGVYGVGAGSGQGVYAVGGGTSGSVGVLGDGAAAAGANATGVYGTGKGTGDGLRGVGGTTGSGVWGTGGSSDGVGVFGDGGATNGVGVHGQGTGTGVGLMSNNGVKLKTAGNGSDTLDGYRLGTWTPTITTTSTNNITHNTQSGFYTRIGNLVFIEVNIAGGIGASAGVLSMTGLPYAVHSGVDTVGGVGGHVANAGLGCVQAGYGPLLMVLLTASSTNVEFFTSSDTPSFGATIGTHFVASQAFHFRFSFCYRTAAAF